MTHFILYDDIKRDRFLPLTHTRAVADLRCGILTLKEKWNFHLKSDVQILSAAYLQPLYEIELHADNYTYINARILPQPDIIQKILDLNAGEQLVSEDETIAFRTEKYISFEELSLINLRPVTIPSEVHVLNNYWDIFKSNDAEINADYHLITRDRKSEDIPAHVQVVNAQNVFIESGAQLDFCILNASHGYIYIGKHAHIMDGAMIRGSAAICDHAVVKMGAKLYEHTTIGPHCKVGGELSNVIFHSFSNKGHDGYLGNALIGSWCNLGADTNCSNLKNDYSSIHVWSEADKKKINTGEQFVGLMMGDHSKCAINTMFNSGTIVGVCCNVFGAGFPPTFIPSFSWGWSEKMITYRIEKAIDANNRMMERRKMALSDADIEILKNVYNFTENLRK